MRQAELWAQAAEARLRADYPLVWKRLDLLLNVIPDREKALWLKAAYAALAVQDLTALGPEQVLRDVEISLKARQAADWAMGVPEALFLAYVLPARVNNEFPDGSRPWLYQQLSPLVQGRDMEAAALAVNAWCFAHAVYQPSDDRTLGPRAVCRRARGRCGEESTLLTAALRAVGIPARQCYAPFWAHCDDNHAWVEFWADGQWHYMGACEPEPVPDVGWFTSAASRAMVVRAWTPDPFAPLGRRMVNVTGRYADTALLRVRTVEAGAPVRFQLVNAGRVCTLHETRTDEKGTASLETGLGCLLVSAWQEGRWTERLVDVRETREVWLRPEDGFDPLGEESVSRWELTPPGERVPPPPREDAAYGARLRRLEADRRAYEASLPTARWLRQARGNHAEVRRFLSLPGYDQADKALLLSALTEKDFADVTCQTLESFLAAALPWKDEYPLDVWRDWILAPRVEWEPLLPIRPSLAARLADVHPATGRDVLAWMAAHIRPLEDHGVTDRRGDAAAYVENGVCPRAEWDLLAVQLCRAAGIPARLSPVTGCFETEEKAPSVPLTLRTEGTMVYGADFTLAQWEEGGYRALKLEGLTVKDSVTLALAPGAYSLLTVRRQIDGTASVLADRFLLSGAQTRTLALEPDRTAEKLRRVPLPTAEGVRLTSGGKENLTAPGEGPALLLFLQPGAEPTEHLLRELLALQEEFRAGGWPVRLVLHQAEAQDNATLRQVLAALPGSACFLADAPDRRALQRAMGLGDGRLPLALVLDRAGCGVYGFANYQIRAAHTLRRILQLTMDN